MSAETINKLFSLLLFLIVILILIPYERLNIPDFYIKLIKLFIAAVALGIALRYLLIS
jgi:hypothetical protein